MIKSVAKVLCYIYDMIFITQFLKLKIIYSLLVSNPISPPPDSPASEKFCLCTWLPCIQSLLKFQIFKTLAL